MSPEMRVNSVRCYTTLGYLRYVSLLPNISKAWRWNCVPNSVNNTVNKLAVPTEQESSISNNPFNNSVVKEYNCSGDNLQYTDCNRWGKKNESDWYAPRTVSQSSRSKHTTRKNSIFTRSAFDIDLWMSSTDVLALSTLASAMANSRIIHSQANLLSSELLSKDRTYRRPSREPTDVNLT
jgi:hypothetical protein